MSADRLSTDELGRIVCLYADALGTYQDEINGLNVYPVPDGDTGTNLRLTLDSVRKALDGAADVPRSIIRGSLMGARGNSGVILSQILRGISEEIQARGGLDPASLAAGLRKGAELAYRAVMRPQEGTILTVAREAAEEAERAVAEGEGLIPMVRRVLARAREALAATPDQLPVLKAAGVVDAGGRGLVLFLECLLHFLDGSPLPAPQVPAMAPAEAVAGAPAEVATAAEGGSLEYRFEVQFLLETTDEQADAYRRFLDGLGDCVLVVGGAGIYNVHVHTNEVGKVLEEAIAIGRPRQIEVTYMQEQVAAQHEAALLARFAGEARTPEAPPERVGVVAVAAGDGVLAILRSLGVRGLVSGGQTMNPSAEDILAGVRRAGAEEVVILPNNRNVVGAARAAAELAVEEGVCRRAEVIPTESPLQAFSALVAFDREASFEANLEAMTAEGLRTKHGEVARAVRTAETPAGHVEEGQYLGLVAGQVAVVDDDPKEAALAVVGRMLEEGDSLVTVVYGEGVEEWDAHDLGRRISERFGVEVEVHRGGQPAYPYLLAVE